MTHGNLDLLLRVRINEIIGYKDNHLSLSEIFYQLGKDYNNRQDYNQIIAIIHKDRQDFCHYIWDSVKDCVIEHDLKTYQVLYKLCLRRWYKDNRVLLYDLGDGWGTPIKYETFKGIEEGFAASKVQTVINKFRELEIVNIALPYELDLNILENNLKEHRKLLNPPEEGEMEVSKTKPLELHDDKGFEEEIKLE